MRPNQPWSTTFNTVYGNPSLNLPEDNKCKAHPIRDNEKIQFNLIHNNLYDFTSTRHTYWIPNGTCPERG